MGLTGSVKFGGFVAVFIIVSTITNKGYAATQDIYSVFNQVIDETADNEVLAKRQGLANAKRTAFYKILKRLARQKDFARFPDVSGATIDQAIRSTSLPEEKFTTGSGRYLAKLNVRFNPKSIRSYLRNADIPYAEAQSKPLIVLPVYRVAGKTLLWEDDNQWFEAWTAQRLVDELVPMVMPLGDISDVGTITFQQASSGDITKLDDIVKKYGVGGTLVTTATLTIEPVSGRVIVDVFGVIQGQGWEASDFYLSFMAGENISTQDLLNQVAIATSSEVLAIWKQRNLLDFQGGVQNLLALAPLSGLKDWVVLKDRLKDIAGIRNVTLENLNTKEALINVEFLGKRNQLQSALAQSDLTLDYTPANGKWVITQN